MPESSRRGTDRPAFPCAPGMRLEAQEKLLELQFAQVTADFARVEAAMDRLERRLWIIASGVVSVVLIEAVMKLLSMGS